MNTTSSHASLAFQATTHCLIGCGAGDIVGVIIGTAFGIPYFSRVIVGIALGFVFGFLFGIYPLIKSHISYRDAARIVLTTEVFSILAMEAAEATTEIIFPGMRRAGFMHFRYWIGLATALLAGFIVAFPVNLFLVRKGVHHHH